MFWLGIFTGIMAYVILVGVLTIYNYRKMKKQHQQSFNDNDKIE